MRPGVQLALVAPAVEAGGVLVLPDGTRAAVREVLPDGSVRARLWGRTEGALAAGLVRDAVRDGRALPPGASDELVDAVVARVRG